MRTRREALIAAAIAVAFVLPGAVPLITWFRQGRYMIPHGSHSSSYAERMLPLLAFIPYLAILWLTRRGLLRVSRAWILGVPLVAAVVMLLAPPAGSQDLFSYLFYGKMFVHGVNPLISPPVSMPHDGWLPFVGWNMTPSVYGPVWTYASAAVYLMSGGHLWLAMVLMKALATAGVFAGAHLLARAGAPDDETIDRRALQFLWNPLILFSVAQTGHVDGVLVALVLAALVSIREEKPRRATVALTLATLIKVYCAPLLLLHLATLARDRDRAEVRAAQGAHLAGAAAISVVMIAPLWAGVQTFHALIDAASRNGRSLLNIARLLIRAVLRRVDVGRAPAHTIAGAGARLLAAGALIAVGVRVARRVRAGEMNDATAWTLLMATVLLVTPWFLPWYVLTFVALALTSESPALGAAALTSTASALTSSPLLTAGAPLAAGLVFARRRRRTRAPDATGHDTLLTRRGARARA